MEVWSSFVGGGEFYMEIDRSEKEYLIFFWCNSGIGELFFFEKVGFWVVVFNMGF